MYDDLIPKKPKNSDEIFKGMKAICINCLSDRTRVTDIVEVDGREDFIVECDYCNSKFYLVGNTII
jgi:hypothetical protein